MFTEYRLKYSGTLSNDHLLPLSFYKLNFVSPSDDNNVIVI